MSEEKFTAIVVGAGPAGSTAALLLAEAGHDVLVIEKGAQPGAKNMFGGRMYSHALNRIIPGFWEEAPVERPVVREVVTFLSGDRSVSLNCQDMAWGKPPYHSFTLLRAEFDAWLASKAEEAGAMIASNIRVDDVLKENGRVVGIRAGEDEMFADVVIAADGVNSLVAQKAGLAKMFTSHQVATGVKQVIELPPDVIAQRFQVEEGAGAAQLFVGDCSKGLSGGGFLYTNKGSISLGLVISAAALVKSRDRVPDILEDFKQNPHVAPMIEGGTVSEHSAHLIPEAGLAMMPELFGDGMVVTGDAAGFVLNLGYVVRGMDFAIASGEAAAKAVMEAKASGDFSKQGLSSYRKHLAEGFVLRDLEAYQKAPEFMENESMYKQYPDLVTALVTGLFTIDGSKPVHLMAKAMAEIKKHEVSLIKLGLVSLKGARWL